MNEARKPAADRLELIWRTVFDALFIVDDDRRYLSVNDRAVELLDAPPGEILQRRIDDFTPAELRPTLAWLWELFERDGELGATFEVVRPDGARRSIEFRATWNAANDGHVIAARELAAAAGAAQPPEGARPLSAREREVLQLTSHGASTREIAEALVLSPRTVKAHLRHVYDKLGVDDRAAAVGEGLRRGLIR